MRDGQGSQQKCVRQAEHGRVGPDSQGQRNDGYQGERRSPPQGAQSVPEVIEQTVLMARRIARIARIAYLLANNGA
jgi:hypothetical protein